MKVLIDTHVLIWWSGEPTRLSIQEGWDIISIDEKFDSYGIRRLW